MYMHDEMKEETFVGKQALNLQKMESFFMIQHGEINSKHICKSYSNVFKNVKWWDKNIKFSKTHLFKWITSSISHVILWACLLESTTRAPSRLLRGNFSSVQSTAKQKRYREWIIVQIFTAWQVSTVTSIQWKWSNLTKTFIWALVFPPHDAKGKISITEDSRGKTRKIPERGSHETD